MKCPHCFGKLVETEDYVRYFDKLNLYECTRCSRGFRVYPDGHWEALYDTARTVYSAKDVEEAQKYDP